MIVVRRILSLEEQQQFPKDKPKHIQKFLRPTVYALQLAIQNLLIIKCYLLLVLPF